MDCNWIYTQIRGISKGFLITFVYHIKKILIIQISFDHRNGCFFFNVYVFFLMCMFFWDKPFISIWNLDVWLSMRHQFWLYLMKIFLYWRLNYIWVFLFTYILIQLYLSSKFIVRGHVFPNVVDLKLDLESVNLIYTIWCTRQASLAFVLLVLLSYI